MGCGGSKVEDREPPSPSQPSRKPQPSAPALEIFSPNPEPAAASRSSSAGLSSPVPESPTSSSSPTTSRSASLARSYSRGQALYSSVPGEAGPREQPVTPPKVVLRRTYSTSPSLYTQAPEAPHRGLVEGEEEDPIAAEAAWPRQAEDDEDPWVTEGAWPRHQSSSPPRRRGRRRKKRVQSRSRSPGSRSPFGGDRSRPQREPWHVPGRNVGFPPLSPVPPRKYRLKRRISYHGVPLGAKVPANITVFVLGGPGCGKGTQCDEIVKNFGFVHLSVGDLLRAEIKKQTPIGISCDALMRDGKLVPSAIPLALIEEAMEKSEKKHFLIDGFPRSLDQAILFEQKIGMPDLVLYLECPFHVMQERLLKRGQTSGRSDDNMFTIKQRFETYSLASYPVIAHYEQYPNLMETISSTLPPVEIFESVAKILEARFGLQSKAATVRSQLVTQFDHSKHDCRRRTIIFVLGGPGCGKGTQCERMVRDFGYSHLSTGDLLRAEVNSGSELGTRCESIMKEGKLVPLSITINLLKEAMDRAKCKRFLIDGFPRAVDQALAFEEKLGPPHLVLCLDCSLELMQKRLIERGKASGRADDNIDTIKKRFETFLTESKPVMDYYREDRPSVVRMIPTDKPPDEVYGDVRCALRSTVDRN